MSSSFQGHQGSVARALALSLAGLLLAALAAPIVAGVAGASTQPRAVQARAVSCAGLDFHPIDYRTQYSYEGTKLFTPDQGAVVFFQCNAALPHRAVVTKVQFLLEDTDQVAEARYCALYRTSLQAATAGVYQVMGQVPSTGFAAQPGVVRLTDTSIERATVDNLHWAYSIQCQINGAITASATEPRGGHRPFVWIYGANVVFRIDATDG